MEDKLTSILEEAFGYPVFLQGSMADEAEYPNHFFTYWNDSADGSSFYSNTEGVIVWQYSLNFYSNDLSLVSGTLLRAKDELKKNGWIVSGAGYGVASDEPTHTGRGISLLYRQEQ